MIVLMPKRAVKKRTWKMTGRSRTVTVEMLGVSTKFTLVECVEIVDLATRARLPIEKHHTGNGNVRVPLGCTARYFERRADTGERFTNYKGIVT